MHCIAVSTFSVTIHHFVGHVTIMWPTCVFTLTLHDNFALLQNGKTALINACDILEDDWKTVEMLLAAHANPDLQDKVILHNVTLHIEITITPCWRDSLQHGAPFVPKWRKIYFSILLMILRWWSSKLCGRFRLCWWLKTNLWFSVPNCCDDHCDGLVNTK